MSNTKITVTYKYLTDVWKNYDGTEQRRCLRLEPRKIISYDYIAKDVMQARWMRDIARKQQSSYDYVPMWHDIAYLEEPFTGGNTLYIKPEYMIGFYNCDMVEIFVTEESYHVGRKNAVKKVRGYFDNTIRLVTPLDMNLNPKNTIIIPLIRCSIASDNTINYVFSNGTELTYSYEDILYRPSFNIDEKYLSMYDDIDMFNRYNLPKQYKNRLVFMFSPQFFDDNFVLNINKNVVRVDKDTGIFAYDLKNSFAYDNFSFTVLLRNKKMITNMIFFINNIKGMHKSFYCPSWANDIVFTSNIVSNYAYVDSKDLYRYYNNRSRKKSIVIFTKKWESYILDIASVTREDINGNVRGKIFFKSSISKPVNLKDILMVSYLNLVRFSSDDFVFNYESNVCASIDLSFSEVDDK